MNKDEWQNSKCNCSTWLKDYICKHVVGLAVTTGLSQFPDLDYQVQISNNRKRGRPKLTAYALNFQPIEVHQVPNRLNDELEPVAKSRRGRPPKNKPSDDTVEAPKSKRVRRV